MTAIGSDVHAEAEKEAQMFGFVFAVSQNGFSTANLRKKTNLSNYEFNPLFRKHDVGG
ncbi:MAG: hypothetical protein ACK5MD_05890 [Flavobacteriales bacterium]